jgi:phospholipid/cholesterol/gamma-HCH transport system ATP-binding protein
MKNANEPLLSIRELTTKFDNKVIHQNLSLDLYEGENLVLLGGSGSGKSVLLRLLVGLEHPAQGKCFYKGQDLFAMRGSQWTSIRKEIAYAFQGGALFDSLSVAENLSYPLREHTDLSEDEMKVRIAKSLDEMGLKGVEAQMPAALSGGMQKRVGLARALMLEPQILLYDEPTAGLDPANSNKISEIILALKKKGKSSLLVTHDVKCALATGDRFAFLQKGKIAALQTREEFNTSPHILLQSYFNGEEIP